MRSDCICARRRRIQMIYLRNCHYLFCSQQSPCRHIAFITFVPHYMYSNNVFAICHYLFCCQKSPYIANIRYTCTALCITCIRIIYLRIFITYYAAYKLSHIRYMYYICIHVYLFLYFVFCCNNIGWLT